MTSNGLVVAGSDEVSVDILLDLGRDAALVGADDGDTGVEGLGHLDLETFAGGELQDDVGVGNDHVEELVVGLEADDATVGKKLGVVSLELVHGLIKDDGGVGVIDGAVAAAGQVSECSLMVGDILTQRAGEHR